MSERKPRAPRSRDEPSDEFDDHDDDHDARDPLGLEERSRSAKQRFDAMSRPIRDRLEEPISRVSSITQKTLALFPVRVWRHFLDRSGFILSSGMSYQALFALFAAVYVVFAVFGIRLTSNPQTLDAFVALLNTYAPGLIGPQGIITTDDLTQIATASTSLFGWTGAVALAGLIWTAIGWVTYSRMAVRSIFGLPKDRRSYVLLKARDFLAGFGFGAILLLATALSVATTSFLSWIFQVLGLSGTSGLSGVLVQGGSLLVVFAIDTLALAVLFRFLSGASMPWHRMWVGSLLGSAALSVLQLLGGTLLSRSAANPLLATFTVFIGLLLWFRLTSIVILVAASWVAVEASDANESLRRVTPEQLAAEQHDRERRALVTAAQVRVREAGRDLETVGWFGRFTARRHLEKAELELAELEAEAPTAEQTGRRNDVGGLP
ncbi:YihY/virulence factor BrkB family protein [Agromyces laixinhei]|uniref:YihY/virulence factor BrkB family protein n=1 Tax=Agromyces laixinhei TaxID=2585717 RepID=UPI001E50660F|nr:YihY/virulence factor BrkB family protein [Agromyces laixinhei]